ncbi:MAG: hypothetical protein K6L80_04520 [Agarilytica sp.]
MLHILSSSSATVYQNMLSMLDTDDTLVILKEVLGTVRSVDIVSKCHEKNAQVFLVLSAIGNSAQQTYNTKQISYREFVTLCTEHSSIHTWY